MRRRLLLSFIVLVLASLFWMPASADATLVAQGTVNIVFKSASSTQTCSVTSVVEFANSGSTFLLNEITPAGQGSGTPPVCTPIAAGPYFSSTTVKQCTPVGGIIFPGSTLTVSGNTYTIRSPYTTCAGKNGTDTIVLTVSPTSVVYRHDLNDGAGSEIHVSGTLARVV